MRWEERKKGKMMIIKFLEITKQPFYSIKADCIPLSSVNEKLCQAVGAMLAKRAKEEKLPSFVVCHEIVSV